MTTPTCHRFAVVGRNIADTVLPAHTPTVMEGLEQCMKKNFLNSTLWLTAQQAFGFFGTRIYEHCEQDFPRYGGAALPLSALEGLEPDVTPLSAAFDTERELFLFLSEHPLPPEALRKEMLLFRGSKWIPLPEESKLFASLCFSPKGEHERPLFLSQRFDSYLEQNPTVKLFNAQAASNPFGIDLKLDHFNLSSYSTPFPPQLSSALTTLRDQHRYLSTQWVLEQDVFRQGYTPKHGEQSHCAVDVVTTGLFCVADFPSSAQTTILQRIPRWVKEKASQGRPHYRLAGRWRLFDGAPKRRGSTAATTASDTSTPMTEPLADYLWLSAHDFPLVCPEVPLLPANVATERTFPFPDRVFNREQLSSTPQQKKH